LKPAGTVKKKDNAMKCMMCSLLGPPIDWREEMVVVEVGKA
jgi:hypothetical protein